MSSTLRLHRNLGLWLAGGRPPCCRRQVFRARSPVIGPRRDAARSRLSSRGQLGKSPAMLTKVCSAAVQGIEAYPVEVEVNVGWEDTNIVILLC